LLFAARAVGRIGFVWVIVNWVEILFDRLGLRLNGRVCDVCLLCVTDTLVRFHFTPARV
jgi:hypothetical protein